MNFERFIVGKNTLKVYMASYITTTQRVDNVVCQIDYYDVMLFKR